MSTTWKIAATDADSMMGVGAVMQVVGTVFGICGCVFVLVVGLVVFVVVRRKKRAPQGESGTDTGA